MRSARPMWAAGVLVVAAVLSGCTTTVTGTAGPAPDGAITAGPTHASAAPTTPAPDATALAATLLQLGDLPDGWSTEGGDGYTDLNTMSEVSSCLSRKDTGADVADLRGAPLFVDPDGDTIYSMGVTYPSQEDVDDDVALLADPRAADCFRSSLQAGFDRAPHAPGAGAGDVSFALRRGPAGDPSNVVAIGDASVPVTTTDGYPTTEYIEFAFITGRMTEDELIFISSETPLPADLRSAAIAAVAQRVAAL